MAVTSVGSASLCNWGMQDEDAIRSKYQILAKHFDERRRRLWAATEAEVLGRGGISVVARATGLSRNTIAAGIRELKGEVVEDEPGAGATERIRKAGAGRPKSTEQDPALLRDLERLVEPVTRGDPESPLRWTSKSTRKLADELTAMGHRASSWLVRDLLRQAGYSLQANRKTLEGGDNPDRNAQFEHINEKVQEEMAANNPVISIDGKKKELVGDFKNAGREWRPKKDPEKVRVYDFIDRELGRATPYGVYDVANNVGWVSVGTDHDTATFAVESIRRWWKTMGREAYPEAKCLLITADGGGSNGSRVRLWKVELQKLADELGFPISVCHFPPGTSKWNKIEHRMFSFISQNWRGKPLVSHEVIVNLIASTTTKKGLAIQSELDRSEYPKGIKIADEALAEVNLVKEEFHGEWNYNILPSKDQIA